MTISTIVLTALILAVSVPVCIAVYWRGKTHYLRTLGEHERMRDQLAAIEMPWLPFPYNRPLEPHEMQWLAEKIDKELGL